MDKFVQTLRSRVRLKAPSEESDSVYQIPDEVLKQIINDAIKAHNPNYTLETLPSAEEPFVLWLAEIEVYYALASGNARFFNIKAEGAELNKQERVEHYMKLIEGRQKHYDTMWAKYREEYLNPVQEAEIIISSPHSLGRFYRLSERPSIVLNAVTVRADSVDLQWAVKTNKRYKVRIYQHDDLIVDEWEIPEWSDGYSIPINPSAVLIAEVDDPWRDKFRAKGLTPDTNYNFAAVVIDYLGRWKHSEIAVHTQVVGGDT